jgi:hypothetical protein
MSCSCLIATLVTDSIPSLEHTSPTHHVSIKLSTAVTFCLSSFELGVEYGCRARSDSRDAMGQLNSGLNRQPYVSAPEKAYTIATQTWYCVPQEGGQPYSFPKTLASSSEARGKKQLCTRCRTLGQLPPGYWNSINNFSDIVVRHRYTTSALLESAVEGCHFCSLLWIAWEQKCSLSQEPDGSWVARAGHDLAVLEGWISLKFRREKQLMHYNGVQADEIHIRIQCGNLPTEMEGQLICYPLNSGLCPP